jgi:hypothetical protein
VRQIDRMIGLVTAASRRVMLFGVLAGAVAASQIALGAEVYKWTDEQGRVHFSDKPPPRSDKSAQQNVSQVRLGSAGPSFNLKRQMPISDSGGASRVPLRLSGLSQALLAAGHTDMSPGQFYTGVGCSESTPLVLVAEEVNFDQSRFHQIAVSAFGDAGWSISGPETPSGGMDLKGEVSNLRVDRCAAPETGSGGGARAYMRIRWVLTGPAGESLYRGSSEGANDSWGTGAEYSIAIERALAMASNNLLADQAFVDKVRAQRFSGTAVSASGATTEASVRWGDATGGFVQRTAEIQGATLMVQAREGSGSGVIIDLSGWALTSARLVGSQPNVMVLIGKLSLPAAVVKRDEVSDVALLRFVRNQFTSVLVAPNPVLPGDAVHVVSAALTPGAVNTVTRSSVTAEESGQGKSRLQLATTEKFSNPGAPVFNQYGELAGLVVMAPEHAGKGVEGLRMVPILQALNALNVDLR